MLAEPYEPSDPAAADIDVRMVDFGCARACPGDCSLEGLSGTPAYMAPEVAAGQPYGPACDLWGVGVMLYQLLTGRFPYWNCGLDELAQMPTRKVRAWAHRRAREGVRRGPSRQLPCSCALSCITCRSAGQLCPHPSHAPSLTVGA